MLALLMKRSMSYTEALLEVLVSGFPISICHAAPHSGCQYVALVLVEFPQVMLKGVDCKVMLLFDPVLPFVSVLPSSELEPEFDPDPELELEPDFECLVRPTPRPIANAAATTMARTMISLRILRWKAEVLFISNFWLKFEARR